MIHDFINIPFHVGFTNLKVTEHYFTATLMSLFKKKKKSFNVPILKCPYLKIYIFLCIIH